MANSSPICNKAAHHAPRRAVPAASPQSCPQLLWIIHRRPRQVAQPCVSARKMRRCSATTPFPSALHRKPAPRHGNGYPWHTRPGFPERLSTDRHAPGFRPFGARMLRGNGKGHAQPTATKRIFYGSAQSRDDRPHTRSPDRMPLSADFPQTYPQIGADRSMVERDRRAANNPCSRRHRRRAPDEPCTGTASGDEESH